MVFSTDLVDSSMYTRVQLDLLTQQMNQILGYSTLSDVLTVQSASFATENTLTKSLSNDKKQDRKKREISCNPATIGVDNMHHQPLSYTICKTAQIEYAIKIWPELFVTSTKDEQWDRCIYFDPVLLI
ncbi:unnamed protein product [Adineta steineri]|uniref:Uncharacterized protein n=1 Tax=Adineta steineri TaxID=433720 RepID=A0A819ZAS3_9BILA|nr:unnamed protein product [Adineta steineri]